MRMTQNRIEAIMTGLDTQVFGHMTPIIQQLMDQALENGITHQDAYGERPFTSAGSKWRPEFNAYWSAVVELVRHTHEPLLSKGSIPKQVIAIIHDIKDKVFGMEISQLWKMQTEFGFVESVNSKVTLKIRKPPPAGSPEGTVMPYEVQFLACCRALAGSRYASL